MNFWKSYICFSLKTPHRINRWLRTILQVGAKEELGSYLGISVGVSRKSTKDFAPILEGVENKLNKLGSWITSPMGRLVLINSLLIGLKAHIMSNFFLPKFIPHKFLV